MNPRKIDKKGQEKGFHISAYLKIHGLKKQRNESGHLGVTFQAKTPRNFAHVESS